MHSRRQITSGGKDAVYADGFAPPVGGLRTHSVNSGDPSNIMIQDASKTLTQGTGENLVTLMSSVGTKSFVTNEFSAQYNKLKY